MKRRLLPVLFAIACCLSPLSAIASSISDDKTYPILGMIDQSSILALLILVFTVGLHWGLGKIWPYPTQWVLQKTGSSLAPSDEAPNTGVQIFLKITLALARLGLWVTSGLLIANLFPLSRKWSEIARRSLITGLASPFLKLGTKSYSLIDFLILCLMLMGLLLAIGAFINFLKGRVLPRMGVNRGAAEIITVITRYALITLGTIVLLQIWGLNLSSLTIVGSALGVGLGLGLQGTAKNLISGLVLLIDRSIKVGDLLQVGEYVGTVERLSARNLIIKTLDRISIIVPTSKILEEIVVNWSHEGPTCRLHIPIGVAYGTDPEEVKTLLLKAAHQHKNVLNSPPADVVFIGFGESSLDFELLIWINQPNRQIFIKSDLLFCINASFREHHIEIPFPQRDLHIRSGQL